MPTDFTIGVRLDDDGRMPAPGEPFYVANEHYEAYDGLTGITLPVVVTSDDEGTTVVTPDGLRVYITRVPVDGATSLAESKRTQLSVFILTEGMGDTDHDAGKPLMQVALNDATVYDEEPTR